ncbi:NAD(P)-dependent dehydrogenase (short-subunit alcohol dehydrogenase family) [Rhizobium pisi]|uniref:NAD(P)-dependent dehydrogenase (Short-subunit alcohol dehydrogenase family) n=2 Tax=Rhizobium TaxID=379 RepID=A0A7W6FKG6_9HYPH|nr:MULTISPECIES: SDR family NAD(P)-dependent oxidoreductase [Rhizobium]MBB3135425.1 NAD(P)-dependent dehydrogenase (short-subunit alcohol dehydrogenase family) [Rhizobium pisi]MBB3916864.1 NAD(P)-dependent dehydrogenase (short-subunit alcohol dehydrogenase family) [Rhizobium fabae]RSB81392.1 SDR family oxidoreductase [Rhizobium pisi]RUM10935.1 SDR family oxidoreductase [Rhizobium fabae]TCA44318.1 SDR family oxidoreductase [Rhizobium pisi]
MQSPSFPELSGKRAIVTGGAAGIGRAIATALSRQSIQVAICDIDLATAERTAAEIGNGTTAHAIDVRKRASVEATFSEVAEKMGGYDILCANAGVSTMQHALELTDEEWDYNFDVNIRGIFLTNQIAARRFTSAGTGVIVNTASLAAKIGAPLLAHYSASKFAVLGWTQALARELAPSGIRVNAVCPGFVKTGMQEREIAWEASLRGVTPERVVTDYIAQTPLGRLETPEDVADVVVFLCSNSARFMTGQGVNVTGGVYTT